jgi:hypothetical protein
MTTMGTKPEAVVEAQAQQDAEVILLHFRDVSDHAAVMRAYELITTLSEPPVTDKARLFAALWWAEVIWKDATASARDVSKVPQVSLIVGHTPDVIKDEATWRVYRDAQEFLESAETKARAQANMLVGVGAKLQSSSKSHANRVVRLLLDCAVLVRYGHSSM